MWATPTIDLDPQQCQVHDSENLTSLSCTDDQHLEAEQMCSQLISSDKLLDCLKVRWCFSDARIAILMIHFLTDYQQTFVYAHMHQ